VRTGLNGAITDSYVAEARLLSAMGALEGSYLLSGEELYDPDTHYNAARGNGDVPLLTPLIRSLDGIGHSFKPANRPIRDQAGPLTTPGVKIGPLKPLAVPPDTMIGVVRPD
jgi:outer membrane protein